MAEHAHKTDDLYFQMHGLTARSPESLNKALQHAIESMHRTLYAPSSGELTSPELALLEHAGMDVDEHPHREDPMMAYATEFGAILATSLTATQAAKCLRGVTPVRARQMIREGTLYACRIDGRWRIPAFQFEGKRLVPNIGVVNAVLPRTLDAVSVLRWYTNPDQELQTPDGDVLSPLDWLKAGMDPEAVVKIARDL
jgi:hypothetical protein